MTGDRPIWLDIARLIERACVGSLTGIDRVELAYAEHVPPESRFVMLGRCSRRFWLFPARAVRRFLIALRSAWDDGRPGDCRVQAMRLLALAAIGRRVPADPTAVYLLVSHRHLHREAALRTALRHAQATFVPLIHDLIPLEFPEYGRPGEAERHRRRIAAVGRLADGIVANSVATAAAMAPWLTAGQAVHVAPLGVAPRVAIASTEFGDRPYFVCVGTIEPRKNHLLLLHLWRHWAARSGSATPRLLIAGRRGWENENVVDLLDRCPALRGHVEELGTVPDTRLTALLRGARALLMPSFAEGFGLPVAEALALGTPVLCSDLPALREAGGHVPEYLDPLDTPAWSAAVADYAAAASPRRDAQLRRLPGWQPETWDSHVASVVEFAGRTVSRRRETPVALWRAGGHTPSARFQIGKVLAAGDRTP